MKAPRFLSLDDLEDLPAPKWLVKDMFEANSLVMLAGPSYSFKSFLLLDWLLCMVTGRHWNGKATVQSKVVYVLGEGKSSLLKRIQAWIGHNKPSQKELEDIRANFRITFEVPQLASKASVDNILADLEAENFKPDVIAVDTFARSMVGMDENDAKDTGLWIEQADRLRQIGYAVIFLHHTKKNTEFGVQYRGSSAIIGAMDTGMTLVRSDNTCTLTITKQKDHDEGLPMTFRRVLVATGGDEESCVLVPVVPMDARFAEEVQGPDINFIIDGLLEDFTYETDAKMAEELARQTDLTLDAAKMRISRRKKQRGGS